MTGFHMTVESVAAAMGGHVTGDTGAVVTGISTDSRTVKAGDLFVAVVGEAFDGHDFVVAALEAGAAAAVVLEGREGPGTRIIVPDTFGSLRDLAAVHRSTLAHPFIAITGSTGKTTTKDLLAAALPNNWASPRSFNNEIGVPLTILRTPPEADFSVVEVGSRGVGNITFLMPAVRPDVAVITNLGTVHLETFGSTANLAKAKFELVEGLTADGVAVLPADEPRLTGRDHDGRTVTFGVDIEATVTAHHVVLDDGALPTFTLDTPVGSVQVSLPLPGAVQATNAAAAVAAGLEVGVDLAVLVDGLRTAAGSAWRMEVHRGRFVVVNDAYNANPQSVEAALRTVAAMPGRHIAVLGEMAELGPISETEHHRMGVLARELGFAATIVVGDVPSLVAGAGDIATSAPDADAARAEVLSMVDDGDVVLVKASRAVGLEAVAVPLIAATKGAET